MEVFDNICCFSLSVVHRNPLMVAKVFFCAQRGVILGVFLIFLLFLLIVVKIFVCAQRCQTLEVFNHVFDCSHLCPIVVEVFFLCAQRGVILGVFLVFLFLLLIVVKIFVCAQLCKTLKFLIICLIALICVPSWSRFFCVLSVVRTVKS